MRTPRLRSTRPFALLGVAAVLGFGVSACGPDEEAINREGEHVEVGNLQYTVEITRYMNRNLVLDESLLESVPEEPLDQRYLAVFIQVENLADSPQTVPSAGIKIVDTRGNSFRPVEVDNEFALELGTTIPAEGEIPEIGSPAYYIPERGAMMLFLIGNDTSENRPLDLVIPSLGGPTERVELDI